MAGPKKIYPWQESGTIPAPEDLSEDDRAALLQQPWFQRTLDMHRMGVNVTPDLVKQLMTQPGAQGYQVQQFDLGDGQKSKMLVDVATGKGISHEDLVKPDFQPRVITQTDPDTGEKIGYAMTTSDRSAVPFKEAQDVGKNPIQPGQAAPVLDENGKSIGHLINDGKKNIFHANPTNTGALLQLLLGGNATEDTPAAGTPAAAAPRAASGAAAAPAARPASAGNAAAGGSGERYVVGRQYRDANGNVATYAGNGQWK